MDIHLAADPPLLDAMIMRLPLCNLSSFRLGAPLIQTSWVGDPDSWYRTLTRFDSVEMLQFQWSPELDEGSLLEYLTYSLQETNPADEERLYFPNLKEVFVDLGHTRHLSNPQSNRAMADLVKNLQHLLVDRECMDAPVKTIRVRNAWNAIFEQFEALKEKVTIMWDDILDALE